MPVIQRKASTEEPASNGTLSSRLLVRGGGNTCHAAIPRPLYTIDGLRVWGQTRIKRNDGLL